MKSNWPAYRIVGVSSVMVTAIGSIGLWLSMRIRVFQGISEREFMQTPIGGKAVWLFAACFLIGLLVMFPSALYLQRRAGVPLPGPTLPNWIAWPVKAILVVVIGIALLLLVAGLVSWLFVR